MNKQTQYEEVALLRCEDTGDSEIVTVNELVPGVLIRLDLMPGTKNYRRFTLQWSDVSKDYRAEVYGRTFVSRGPKVRDGRPRPQVRRGVDRKSRV